MASDRAPRVAAGARLAAIVGRACACRACLRKRKARDPDGWPILMGTLVVCLTCGNARCPRAADHMNPCNGTLIGEAP